MENNLLQLTGIKAAALYRNLGEHGLSDTAGSKVAVMKCAVCTVRPIRHTVDVYVIKIGTSEKVVRETRFCAPVKERLVNDFRGIQRVICVLLIGALQRVRQGIGLIHQCSLLLQRLDYLTDLHYPSRIRASIRLGRPVQQGFQGHIVPALEIVVYISHPADPVAAVVLDGVNILQQIRNLLADLIAAGYGSIFHHGIASYCGGRRNASRIETRFDNLFIRRSSPASPQR